MGDPLHIGLVGCGKWGRHILRDLKFLGCRVTVVAPSESSRANAKVGNADGVVNRISDLSSVDGVVVATPVTTHGDAVDEALARDCPVFCEKPLTNEIRDARRLAESAPRRLFVMDKWRYHPGIEALAEIARSGELGQVIGLQTKRLGWGNRHRDVDCSWVLLPHDLSIAIEILGHIPRPKCAFGHVVGGSILGLTALGGGDPWLSSEIGVRSRDHIRSVRLLCSRGIAEFIDPYSDHILVTDCDSDSTEFEASEADRRPISTEMPLLRELQYFVEHLRGGPPPRSSAEEALAVVETIAEIRSLVGVDPV